MTNSIIIYNFNQNQIRTTVIDNEPWFVATDVAKALEYRNAPDAIRYLDEDERGTLNERTPGKELSIINESGLYSLILRSRKPEAKAFKKFVTSEVLPSIRRTGSYGTPVSAPVDMKAIGGMVKRCAAVAIRDELEAMYQVKAENIDLKNRLKQIQLWANGVDIQ